jgi:hypothetical protein
MPWKSNGTETEKTMNDSSRERTAKSVIESAKEDGVRRGPAERRSGLARFAQGFVGAGLGMALVLSIPGCHKSAQAAGSQSAVDQNSGDPADANMAGGGNSSGQPAQVLGESAQEQNQQQGEDYSQQPPAPIVRQGPDSGQQSYDNGAAVNGGYDGQPSDAQADDIYANDLTDAQASTPPPPLPEYEQPPAPDPDYLWTPGYWGWGPYGYYWVPGYWVAAPYEGALWTPGYWGFYGGFYRFHHGYWGLHIGYYGGVDYGYGYVGHGYYGGYWNGGHFFYNTTITRVNVNVIRNVYVHPVRINNVVISGRIGNRVSFNGGRGGVVARPLPAETRVLQEKRIPPMTTQVQAQHAAAGNRQQLFSQNQGRPAVAVDARPIAKDRVLPAAVPARAMPAAQPRAGGSAGQPGIGGNARPGSMQTPAQGARPQAGQAQPQSQMRQAQPQSQIRQGQPQQAQPQSQTRQAQPQPQSQMRQAQPQAQTRQAQPQPQAGQAQPQPQASQAQQPQSQMRQAQPQQAQPQPQARPQEQARPQQAPQQQAQPRPQPQAAPRPQTAPAARPQPAPAVRPQPKEEEKPR